MSEIGTKDTRAEEIRRNTFMITDMMKALKHYYDLSARGGALGYTQEKALRIIAEHNGILQRELQDLMDSKRSALSLLLTKLEEVGFIEKNADPGDKRKVIICLTEEGREYIDEHEVVEEEADPSLCLNDEEKEYYLAITERMIQYLGNEMKSKGIQPVGPEIEDLGKRHTLPPLGDRPAWNDKYLRGAEKAHIPFDIEHYGDEDEGPFWLEHPDWPNPWVKDKGEDPFF